MITLDTPKAFSRAERVDPNVSFMLSIGEFDPGSD